MMIAYDSICRYTPQLHAYHLQEFWLPFCHIFFAPKGAVLWALLGLAGAAIAPSGVAPCGHPRGDCFGTSGFLFEGHYPNDFWMLQVAE